MFYHNFEIVGNIIYFTNQFVKYNINIMANLK